MKKFIIADVRCPDKPVVFQDMDAGTQSYAVYSDISEAETICTKMNAITSLTQYVVKED